MGGKEPQTKFQHTDWTDIQLLREGSGLWLFYLYFLLNSNLGVFFANLSPIQICLQLVFLPNGGLGFHVATPCHVGYFVMPLWCFRWFWHDCTVISPMRKKPIFKFSIEVTVSSYSKWWWNMWIFIRCKLVLWFGLCLLSTQILPR